MNSAPELARVLGVRDIRVDGSRVFVTHHNGHSYGLDVSIDDTGALAASGAGGVASSPVPAASGAHGVELRRAAASALTPILGYFVGSVKHSAGETDTNPRTYAELAWLANAGRAHGMEVLGRKQRRHHRVQIQRVLHSHGLRVPLLGRAHAVRHRRVAAFQAVPDAEGPVRLHGSRWGRFRPFADRETGTVPGAFLRALIPGLASLAAVPVSSDPGQQGRYLFATVSALPGVLYSMLLTSARWGRKRRDDAPLHLRVKPPLIDNLIGTVGGAVTDVALRLSGSQAAGGGSAALYAEIAGRRLTNSIGSTINEVSSFSPLLVAELLSKQATEIAGRGEPVQELAELERRSRQVHLAINEVLGKTPRQDAFIYERLASHQGLVARARSECESAGLQLGRLRTSAAPKGVPKIKRWCARLLAAPLIASAVASAGAAWAGQAAYAVLGLPGLATTAVTVLTMARLQADKVDDEAAVAGSVNVEQRLADDALRRRVRVASWGLPSVRASSLHGWEAERPKFNSAVYFFKQATKAAIAAGAMAAVAFAIPEVRSLAPGLLVSSALGPYAAAVQGVVSEHVLDKARAKAANIDERADVGRLLQQHPRVAALIGELDAIDEGLRRVVTGVSDFRGRPTAIGSEAVSLNLATSEDTKVDLTNVEMALAERGSKVLRSRFHAAVQRGTFSQSLVPAGNGDPRVSAVSAAAAFDRWHEKQLGDVAVMELLASNMNPWLPEHLRLPALFPDETRQFPTGTRFSPTMDDDNYVELARAVSNSSFARRANGSVAFDGSLLAHAFQAAAQSGGVRPDSATTSGFRVDASLMATKMALAESLMDQDIRLIAGGVAPVRLLSSGFSVSPVTRPSKRSLRKAQKWLEKCVREPGFRLDYLARVEERMKNVVNQCDGAPGIRYGATPDRGAEQKRGRFGACLKLS
ncbi:MAG: hypothetical protein HOQ05_11055 [Corynebacteriales bacterium]|nr:hypothetical protein [Mycobacteriales bacterium]